MHSDETRGTRGGPRRNEDVKTETLLERLSKALDRWKGIVIAIGVLGGAAAGTGAYLGAYLAIPTRVANVEAKVDTIRAQLNVQARERETIEEKIDLLLAINCPGVQRADLVRPCRPYIIVVPSLPVR